MAGTAQLGKINLNVCCCLLHLPQTSQEGENGTRDKIESIHKRLVDSLHKEIHGSMG